MFTASELARSDRVKKLGDLVLLPAHMSHVGALWQTARQRIKQLANIESDLDVGLLGSEAHFQKLYYAYEDYRHRHGREPGWIQQVPKGARLEIRRNFFSNDERFEHFGPIPYTGVSYVVIDDGPATKTGRAFGLGRLRGIRQLGYLEDPGIWRESTERAIFGHNRYQHSHDVYALATLIAYNCELSRTERELLQEAALTHDVLTPAGGDSIKWIDPPAFDEDAWYRQALTPQVREHLRRRRISAQALIRTVAGQGKLGSILDVADKCAYLARDLAAFLPNAHYEADPELCFLDLQQRMGTNRYVCGVWDDVEIVRNKVAFRNPERLLDFLMVRVLMFRDLYYNPRARLGESLVSQKLVGKLYRESKLTRAQLLSMDDFGLERQLTRAYGIDDVIGTCCGNADPVRAPFAAKASADALVQKLRSEGNGLVLLEEINRRIKTGSNFLVAHKGRAVPLAKVLPREVAELEREAILPYQAVVYYFKNPAALPISVRKALAA